MPIRASRTTPSTSSASSTQAATVAGNSQGSTAMVRSPMPVRLATSAPHRASAPPAAIATAGSSDSSIAVAPYAETQAPRARRTLVDHGPRAAPLTRTAGAPDQNSPSGTVPNTADPGATSASSPTALPGQSMLRVPIRARFADADLADAEHVTVDPVAGQVDLGLDRAARCPAGAGRSPAGRSAGRRRRPIRAPSSRAYQVIHGAPARPVAPSSSTSRSATQSRRCTLPPARMVARASSPRSSRRAPAAASTIRPGGVTKTSQPASDRPPRHGRQPRRRRTRPRPRSWRRAARPASAGAASARSRTVNATIWPAWVLSGVGRHRRLGGAVAGDERRRA